MERYGDSYYYKGDKIQKRDRGDKGDKGDKGEKGEKGDKGVGIFDPNLFKMFENVREPSTLVDTNHNMYNNIHNNLDRNFINANNYLSKIESGLKDNINSTSRETLKNVETNGLDNMKSTQKIGADILVSNERIGNQLLSSGERIATANLNAVERNGVANLVSLERLGNQLGTSYERIGSANLAAIERNGATNLVASERIGNYIGTSYERIGSANLAAIERNGATNLVASERIGNELGGNIERIGNVLNSGNKDILNEISSKFKDVLIGTERSIGDAKLFYAKQANKIENQAGNYFAANQNNFGNLRNDVLKVENNLERLSCQHFASGQLELLKSGNLLHKNADKNACDLAKQNGEQFAKSQLDISRLELSLTKQAAENYANIQIEAVKNRLILEQKIVETGKDTLMYLMKDTEGTRDLISKINNGLMRDSFNSEKIIHAMHCNGEDNYNRGEYNKKVYHHRDSYNNRGRYRYNPSHLHEDYDN